MGKGWTRRPQSVDRKTMDELWEQAFSGRSTDRTPRRRRRCDCHLYERQVCDICQRVDERDQMKDAQ